jgi:hypothetical protein
MKTLALLLCGALALTSLPAAAHPHVSVGLGFGFPYHYYYAPYVYSPWLYPYAPAPYAVPVPTPVPGEKPAADLYVYPEAGQSTERVTRDRSECHDWAAGESDYDPLTAKRQKTDELANYDRAFTACMQGRNYSVG